jgi:putative flippase GtrA
VRALSRLDAAEVARYLVNGAAATAVHFAVLWLGLDVLGVPSAGMMSAVASLMASTASFFGNRMFVFAAGGASVQRHATRFAAVYLLIALFHGGFLYGWTDLVGLDYRPGFVIALVIATVAGYLLNRHFVFSRA